MSELCTIDIALKYAGKFLLCSGMVVVPKANGRVRICVNLTHLNKAVKREIHPMSSVDESLAKLGKASVFSKLDANSGFWQLPLDEESKLLTTFITPQGRFAFNRIPFRISSAPEIFTRTISVILQGLDGVICHMDDISWCSHQMKPNMMTD